MRKRDLEDSAGYCNSFSTLSPNNYRIAGQLKTGLELKPNAYSDNSDAIMMFTFSMLHLTTSTLLPSS